MKWFNDWFFWIKEINNSMVKYIIKLIIIIFYENNNISLNIIWIYRYLHKEQIFFNNNIESEIKIKKNCQTIFVLQVKVQI